MASTQRRHGRVLVLGPPDSREALAAVRSLARHGWTVGYGSSARLGLTGWSRAVTHRHRVARPDAGAKTFLDSVQQAVVAGGYDVVFGAGDPEVLALSWGRDRLTAVVPLAPHDQVVAAIDKWSLTERAAAVGLATPRSVLATSAAVAEWEGPAVVKPRLKWTPVPAPGASWVPATYAGDPSQLRGAVARIDGAVLQEPIDGRLTAVVVLADREGVVVAGHQQEATTTFPARAGISARARTIPVEADLMSGVERLVAALGWFGMAQMQFVSPRPGDHRLIDFNGRFYGSMSLGVAAGLDLAPAWAAMALGDDPPELGEARVGTRYIWLGGEVRRAWEVARDEAADAERPDPSRLVAELTDVARYAWSATGSIASSNDPLPVLVLPLVVLAGWARRLLAGVRRRLRRPSG